MALEFVVEPLTRAMLVRHSAPPITVGRVALFARAAGIDAFQREAVTEQPRAIEQKIDLGGRRKSNSANFDAFAATEIPRQANSRTAYQHSSNAFVASRR